MKVVVLDVSGKLAIHTDYGAKTERDGSGLGNGEGEQARTCVIR